MAMAMTLGQPQPQPQLHFSHLSGHCLYHATPPSPRHSLYLIKFKPKQRLQLSFSGGEGSGEVGGRGGDSDDGVAGFGILGGLVNGWRSRVGADPQFRFKVLMEELVGVSACVVGDMATRPNFGLNELDFIFSTLVVGSILNFTLMYLLAPTLSSSSSSFSNLNLPAIFASCPNSHMFEPGPYSILHLFGTLVYKGAVFAFVGFAAGHVGTAISNGLIMARKKMDPNFETPNKPLPTPLNAFTWAAHMGVSSNLRYQTLNGVEFILEKALPSLAFKTSVFALRPFNNMTFVMLARFIGSQRHTTVVVVEKDTKDVRLMNENSNETIESTNSIKNIQETKAIHTKPQN